MAPGLGIGNINKFAMSKRKKVSKKSKTTYPKEMSRRSFCSKAGYSLRMNPSSAAGRNLRKCHKS